MGETGCEGISASCAYFLLASDTETLTRSLPLLQDKLGTCQHRAATETGNETDVRRKHRRVVLSCANASEIDGTQCLPQYFMYLCRKYGLLRNERVTLLSSIDQMIAIQLCLAEKNKQESGEYDVETSSVLKANKDIIREKLAKCQENATDSSCEGSALSLTCPVREAYTKFLLDCNHSDQCDVLSYVREEEAKNEEIKKEIRNTCYVFLGSPKTLVEEAMVSFLCQGRAIQEAIVEVPLDSEETVNATYQDQMLSELLDKARETQVLASVRKNGASISEAHVRLVFVSYLELLVNSRSELALARVINTPDRKLNHTAFTDLKREARAKNLTMYQTALSFVMRIRLGGKGYAPEPECPLSQHVKGIAEFVDLMQKLQTVIEEDENIRSASKRVINIIKKEILKCKNTRLRAESVEQVAEGLHVQIASVISEVEKLVLVSPDKSASNGGSMLGRKTLRALRHLLDRFINRVDGVKTVDYLCDAFSSQKTPVRFPSIFSQFRSPEEDEPSPDSQYNKSLSDRMAEKMPKKPAQPSALTVRYQACNDWAVPVHQVNFRDREDQKIYQQSEIVVLPSKTLVCPASGSKTGLAVAKKVIESINDKENAQKSSTDVPLPSNNSKPAQVTDKGKKRMADIEAKPPAKKAKPSQKSCRRKLLPQVKGQQQLTKFFRV